MESNGISFFITLILLIAVYVSLGRRQYLNPRPHINREPIAEIEEDCYSESCGC